jgi:adenylate cyclase
MTPEGISCHLIAIVSADVKDCTRLMSQDDVGTIRTLTAYKEAMEVPMRRYRGRVVDATGEYLGPVRQCPGCGECCGRLVHSSEVYLFMGQPGEAVKRCKEGLRLNPYTNW